MKTETFQDGSTIETNEETGNRTVCGAMAHKEYFKRLQSERITRFTSPAIIAYCVNPDGTRKAELIRTKMNPALVTTFGEYGYEVWTSSEPETVVRYASEQKARVAFEAAMIHGTNGKGLSAP